MLGSWYAHERQNSKHELLLYCHNTTIYELEV